VLEYEVVRSADRLGHIANEIAEAPVVSLDCETTGHSPHHAKIRLCSVNTGKGCYVIDLFETKTLGPVGVSLHEGKAIKVGQTLKFDQKFLLREFGVELYPVFDTHRASAMLHNGKDDLGHNLYDLYNRELGIGPEAPDLGGSNWSGPLTKEQLDYAAEDITHLPKLRDSLRPKVMAAGLGKACTIEFGAILPEAAIELNGFWLDKDRWLKLVEENKEAARKLEEELLSELPRPDNLMCLPGLEAGWNLDSQKQLLKSLQKMGVKIEDTAKTTLAMVAGRYPVISKIMKYRGYATLLKMFGPEYLNNIDSVTGRIHCDYWPLTGAGRYSCSKPNLQQIPRKKDYRKCFRAQKGKKFVIADYSQIELRLVAEASGDKTLIAIYLNGEDAHQRTASIVSEVPLDKVTKDQRQMAKPINFGLMYGMGPEKLVLYAATNYGVMMTVSQAEKFHRRYFDAYSAVKAWHDRMLRDGKRTGMSFTNSGRLRYLDPEKAFNEFFNCVDAETEALTTRGWVKGFDLDPKDVLLTKNPDTGELEWQAMTDLKLWPAYEGKLYEFRSKTFNAVTTPDHRWLVFNKASRRDEERTSATLSLHGDHRIHRTGMYLGPKKKVYSDDLVELVGWFLTDGSFSWTGTNKTRPTANLFQSLRANPHKVEMIDVLVERMNVLTGRYYYGELSTEDTFEDEGNYQVIWRLQADVSAALHDLFPSRVLTPEFMQKLTGPQAKLLVRTMMLGDGHEDADGKRSFCSGSKTAAEMFQALCVLAGMASTLHERDMSKHKPESKKLRNVPRMGLVWYVTLLRRDKVQVQKHQCRVFESKEGVWCPIVPNTFFVARREGQVFVTGNTPIQGTGADGLKRSMPIVYKKLKAYGDRAKMVHMVHDEIIIEADDDPDLLLAVQTDLEDGMREGMEALMHKVPTVVEGGVGESWAEK
jgi:DNA polymerase I-like protein with 3'-5' exonuclease and polymerase domains